LRERELLRFYQESWIDRILIGRVGDNSNIEGCLGIIRKREIFILQMIPRVTGLDLLILSRSSRRSSFHLDSSFGYDWNQSYKNMQRKYRGSCV